MSHESSAFFFGIWAAAIFCFMAFHAAESVCKTKNNVADCEWSRTPFTPAVKEPTP